MPLVTVIIPTLNSDRVLGDCLASISDQDLEHGAIEIVVADAGSSDRTREIAESYGARIVDNPLRTGEAGKAAALRYAGGAVVCFVDSDNILIGRDWLRRMLRPFDDPEIVASEPLRYAYRPVDNYLTRYFAQLGMNDPLCLFLGMYDRICLLTGKWTDLPVVSQVRDGYIKVRCSSQAMPTIGANGFAVRRARLKALHIGDYLFDVDVARALLVSGEWAVAKVDCAIVHLCAADVRTYRRKQRRRIQDFMFYSLAGQRSTIDRGAYNRGVIAFVCATLLGWPVIGQATRGLLMSRDSAWLFHPAACAITLFEYGWAVIAKRWQGGPLARTNWRQ